MEGRPKLSLDSDKDNNMTAERAAAIGIKFGLKFPSVAVIRDSDPSSEMVSQALISGLLAAGSTVYDANLISVPEALAAFSADCGCILSVGDPDEDGKVSSIVPYSYDGTPLDNEEIHEILRQESDKLPDYKGIGRYVRVEDAERKYLSKIAATGVSSQGYVIIDCGCGSTSKCAPQMLKAIGADVVTFDAYDCAGKLPRHPGLAKTNLMNIANFVNASIGSIGIAYNGNGTRLALMDESGKYVPGDRLCALMLMYLQPTVAVIPFDSPCVVEDAFNRPLGLKGEPDNDRKLIRAKNDLQSIITAMKENNADFGALTNGTFIFPELGYCPDALYASAVISELAGKRSIRNVLEDIPVYSNRSFRVDFDGDMKKFANKLEERIGYYDIVDRSVSGDAWKMILKHGTYTIKRSDADPKKLVIFAESSDLVYLITMLEQAKDMISFCI